MVNSRKKIIPPVQPMLAGFALAQKKITAAILQVPPGQVASYAQIGEAAGFVRAGRLVARVLRVSDLALPWWRIVRSDGSCAVEGQLERLKKEGILVKQSRIDMNRYRWQHLDYVLFGTIE
jgi:alkylated DNA nucleotide flippase Atl1